MNIIEAIEAAKMHDTVVRRPSWEEGQILFWKNDTLCWNKPSSDIWEERLGLVSAESLLASDWVEA